MTTIDPNTASRADLTAFLKAMGQYSGLSQAPIARLREVAAHAVRVQDTVTDRIEAALADTPAIEVVDKASQTARADAAKAEHKAIKAWEKAGRVPPRPATPNLDALNADFTAGKPKVTNTTPRAPRVTKTFVTADAVNGEHTCRTCSTSKPVSAFPTVKGPEVRSDQCRACRDAAKAGKAA